MGVIKKVIGGIGSAIGLGSGGDSGGADASAVQAAQAAQTQATQEANRIAQEQAQRQTELNNMNKNYAADLSTENRAMVESAGTANDAASLSNPDQKRRRASSGLASSLGINV